MSKKRTPRFYDGIQSPFKKMDDLLPKIVDSIKTPASMGQEELFSFWKQLVGEKAAPLAIPVSFVNEVLTIKVKSATLYTLLSVYEKPRLLQRLQEKFQIRKLIFRIG